MYNQRHLFRTILSLYGRVKQRPPIFYAPLASNLIDCVSRDAATMTSGTPVFQNNSLFLDVGEGIPEWALSNIPEVDSVLSAEGTMLIKWRPGYASDDSVGGAGGVVSVRDNSASLFYLFIHPVLAAIKSYDGSTFYSNSETWLANTWYNVALQWGYDDGGEKMRIGISTTSTIAWDAGANFDGAYIKGTDLILGHTIYGPMHLKDFRFYDSKISDNEIKAILGG